MQDFNDLKSSDAANDARLASRPTFNILEIMAEVISRPMKLKVLPMILSKLKNKSSLPRRVTQMPTAWAAG